MYFTDGLIQNSGAVRNLTMNASFSSEGFPKPLILVGTNGSGKTGILASLADALIEIAAQRFQNVTKHTGQSRAYYRLIGGRTRHAAQPYEFTGLNFKHETSKINYVAKNGTATEEAISQGIDKFLSLEAFNEKGHDKLVRGDLAAIEAIFDSGAYVFFPANRSEVPHWINSSVLSEEPTADFLPRFSTNLNQPIIVNTALQDIKPWLIDVLYDQSLPAEDILSLGAAIRAGGVAQVEASAKLNRLITTSMQLNHTKKV